MIRTKSFAYTVAVYALFFVAYLLASLVVWGVLVLGAALVSHQPPEFSTAEIVTTLILLAVFVYADYRKTLQRRRDEAEGWRGF